MLIDILYSVTMRLQDRTTKSEKGINGVKKPAMLKHEGQNWELRQFITDNK